MADTAEGIEAQGVDRQRNTEEKQQELEAKDIAMQPAPAPALESVLPPAVRAADPLRQALNFREDDPQSGGFWESDGGSVRTQAADPDMLRNDAPILGRTPPLRAGVSQDEIDAKAWLDKEEAEEREAAGFERLTRMTEDASRLEKKVQALRETGTQKVPREIEAWQAYTSDQSIVSTEDEIQRNLLELGFAGLEAAFRLGTSQTQSIILLEEENRQLKRKNDALEKDCGVSIGYMRLEDVERLKAKANHEIEDRDAIIERLKDRLTTEKRPYSRDIAQATAEIEKLRLKGNEFKERIAQLMEEGLQQKSQIESLSEAFAQETATKENLIMQLSDLQHSEISLRGRVTSELTSSSSAGMENDSESSKATRASSDNTAEQLQNEVHELRKELTELKGQDPVSQKVCNDEKMALTERILKLEQDAKLRLERQQDFLRSLPGRKKLRATSNLLEDISDKQPKVIVDAVDIAILRIQLQLTQMVQQRALYGMQTDDTAAAERTGLEALTTSQDLHDKAGISRVSFWLGVVYYYSSDLFKSHRYFRTAEKLMMLPEYEEGYLGTWLEQSEGPARDAKAYRRNAHPELRRTQNRSRSPQGKDREAPECERPGSPGAAESESNAEETVL